jgi:uncharacterized protein (TIGR03435 family)
MHRIAVLLLAFGTLAAQAPAVDPNLKFEVASIKPSVGGAGGQIRPAPGGQRYVANGVPLSLMLMVAYRIKADQLIGGPAWITADRFEMDAKAEKPSTAEELRMMLRNLLTERFQLKFHTETKELPVYVLSVDKGGPKMTPHDGQSAGDPWIDQAIDKIVQVKLKATFVPMDYFAWRLGLQVLDRTVINQTNLMGGYDFDLSYTRDLPPGMPENVKLNGEPVDLSGPTIFQAFRQQLGLRLDSQKGPVNVMVIDHAERPTGN